MRTVNTLKILLFITAIFSVSLLNFQRVFALEVTCQSGECLANPNNVPLFNETNIFPNWASTKIIKAINLHSETRTFAIEVNKTSFSDMFPDPLSDVLNVVIVELESGSILYGPVKLSAFRDAGYVLLSDVPSGESRNYAVTVNMDNVGNEYQNKKVQFDLAVGIDALKPTTNNTFNSNNSFTGNAIVNAGLTTLEPLIEPINELFLQEGRPPLFDIITEPLPLPLTNILPFFFLSILSGIILILLLIYFMRRIMEYLIARRKNNENTK